jgi:DHA1 family multidrug/chloramphenicol efflux transport protein-like MFS transporter
MQKFSVLNRSVLWFPLALVLFEFSVYIGNDMVQPAMLAVVHEFGVGYEWVSSSMTAYLVGGALLQWLLGPLSDRIGRRPVMLWGAAFFVLSCLATLLVHDIGSFLALRVIQGIGLSFITAVGYAAIQESFEETAAIRVSALMANVALIAPLAGPVAGAALLTVAPWRLSFVLVALCAALAWLGLWRKMPETVDTSVVRPPLRHIGRDYRALLGDLRFLAGAAILPLMTLPLLGWIALSPVLLIEGANWSALGYGLAQVPVFGALIAGNLWLARYADRLPLERPVVYSVVASLAGALLMLATCALPTGPAIFGLIAGCCLVCLGQGLGYAVLYRFALTSSDIDKGAVAAALGILSMGGFALGVELYRQCYFAWGLPGFAVLSILLMLLFWWLSRPVVAAAMQLREPVADSV